MVAEANGGNVRPARPAQHTRRVVLLGRQSANCCEFLPPLRRWIQYQILAGENAHPPNEQPHPPFAVLMGGHVPLAKLLEIGGEGAGFPLHSFLRLPSSLKLSGVHAVKHDPPSSVSVMLLINSRQGCEILVENRPHLLSSRRQLKLEAEVLKVSP